jgi:hypothetical protein
VISIARIVITTTTGFHDLFCGGLYSALIVFVGYAVLCAAFRPGVRHWLEILGLSYAAGAGVVSLLLFLVSMAGFTPGRASLIGVLAAAVVLLRVCLRRKSGLLQASIPSPRQKFGPLAVLSAASLSLLLLSLCNVWARAGWPALLDIDSFAIWMFKAKWVYTQPLRPLPAVFRDPILSYSHQDYPLAFPFQVAGLMAAVGRFDDRLIKLILLPNYLALIAVIYAGIRRFHRRATALVITTVFVTAPTLTMHAGFGVAETPLILAYTCALVLMVRWMETAENGCLPLAGLFAAIAAFTKNEGLALLPMLGIAILIGWPTADAIAHPSGETRSGRRQRNPRQFFLAVGMCAAVIAPWLIFRLQLPRTHEDYGGRLTNLRIITQNLPRLGFISTDFLARFLLLDHRSVGLIWVVLLITACAGWRAFASRTTLAMWLLLLAQLGLYVITFVVTPWDPHVLVPMIGGKLISQASPIAALLIALHLRATNWPTPSPSAMPPRK